MLTHQGVELYEIIEGLEGVVLWEQVCHKKWDFGFPKPVFSPVSLYLFGDENTDLIYSSNTPPVSYLAFSHDDNVLTCKTLSTQLNAFFYESCPSHGDSSQQ